MQPLLAKNILEKISRYAQGGACPDSEAAMSLLRRVHEHLAFNGATGHLQKWCLCAKEGCFSAPEELELPIKYIDNGRVHRVWDHRAEFLQQANEYECEKGIAGIIQDINTYYTEYDPPSRPVTIAIKSLGDEDVCGTITIRGNGVDGNPIRTHYDDMPVDGEVLEIDNVPKRTQALFNGQLGQIVKTVTKYPVEVRWYDPETKEDGFLALLPARNEVTTFRRFRLSENCEGTRRLIVLGRIRFKNWYEPNDVLPFTSENLYIHTADMIYLRDSNSLENSVAKETMVQNEIIRQNEYSKTPTSIISVGSPLSSSANSGLTGFSRRGRSRRMRLFRRG